MRKRMAGLALAASLLAAVPVSPAQAESPCLPPLPDGVGCLVRCMVNWHVDFVMSGGQHPGYVCAKM